MIALRTDATSEPGNMLMFMLDSDAPEPGAPTHAE